MVISRGKVTYIRGALAGAGLAYVALYAAGLAPLWFGPEWSSWSKPMEDSDGAMELLKKIEKDRRFLRFRAKGSSRNFLQVHNSTEERRIVKRIYIDMTRGVLIGVVKFGPDVEGPPRCVHGGCSAAVADACLGILAHHISIIPSVTANLTVNYRKKIPLGSAVGIECRFVEKSGRKIKLSFRIFELEGSASSLGNKTSSEEVELIETECSLFDENGVVYVDGSALFVQPIDLPIPVLARPCEEGEEALRS